MAWAPRWRHVSQLHGDGGGWNDCWEACLARYLRERDPALLAGDDWALIDAIGIQARGRPDSPDNPYTTQAGAAASLAAYDVEARWSESLQETLAAPWAICLVDGAALAPAQYPPSWLGGAAPGGDHFIIWLPFWQGSAYWFNDPLAYANGQGDCRYDAGSLAAAFVWSYLLPSTGNGEETPTRLRLTRRCALKVQPDHRCLAVAALAADEQVTALAGRRGEWRQVRTSAGISGWVPAAYLG